MHDDPQHRDGDRRGPGGVPTNYIIAAVAVVVVILAVVFFATGGPDDMGEAGLDDPAVEEPAGTGTIEQPATQPEQPETAPAE